MRFQYSLCKPLNEEVSSIKSMYNSEWNSCIDNFEDLDGYEDIYSHGVNSVFTTNQFHELTLPARTIGDEYIWVAPGVEEDAVHSSQRLFENFNTAQIFNESEYFEVPNYSSNNNREYLANSQVSNQNKYSNINQATLNVDETLPINSSCARTSSENSSVSHTSTLHGVWVVPNRNNDTNLLISRSKLENSSSDDISSSVETSNSEIRRRFHFSRQRSDIMLDGTRIKTNNNYKYKNNEISMLIASGGAPLGRLDEIGGVEWYPERQSWKVVGHTGISWCVRRKTWRVWFITSGGTRATRSFNPKEHGTVAAALKVAIEFLENKRAEKSPNQKSLRGRARRSSLYSNNFGGSFSKSNNLSLNNTYKNSSDLIN
ncbi:uncharacterized protein cubi_01457 [Cryptosporidium ubiquitum]|uniref:Uncharacterized protein n=1 Tax=Cryptosporidium ubiquitum TaxID=857276 RepID=A0A1J4MGH5_9CRYT|nr:uncharacterized protein cubi_01457 [Cryptosporidium ubiquitum]OII72124.1 hypothetical protein cubi_01457 [Cryptosporidium ubiquitum]